MSVGLGCEVEFGDAARNTEMVVRYAKRTRSVAPRETAIDVALERRQWTRRVIVRRGGDASGREPWSRPLVQRAVGGAERG